MRRQSKFVFARLDSMNGPKHVTIIGGGISGLAAAFRLRQLAPSVSVDVLEAADQPGGVIRTISKAGFLIEGAADNFLSATPCVLQLCKDVGLCQELIRPSKHGSKSMVLSHGELESVPTEIMSPEPTNVWPLVASKILSPKGKIRSGLEFFVPRKRNTKDESLRSFFCRRFGVEMFERVVQPLASVPYVTDPERSSVSTTTPHLAEMESRHGSLLRATMARRWRRIFDRRNSDQCQNEIRSMALRDGMSSLVAGICDRLGSECIRYGSVVESIERTDRAWSVLRKDERPLTTDAIIVATPASQAAKLLRDVEGNASELLSQIEYSSCAVVSLGYRKSQIGKRLSGTGLVVPQVEGRYILSCSLASEQYPGRAPEDAVLMRVFMGGSQQPGLLRLPEKQLIDLAHMEVSSLLEIKGEPILKNLIMQKHALPQYDVGHQQRVEQIEAYLAAHPTIQLAGSGLSGGGIPGCIASGQQAAWRVAESLGSFAENGTSLQPKRHSPLSLSQV